MIAIDIDSTLYDFETPFRQAFLDLALEEGDKDHYFRGAYQSWVEWRSPWDVCGGDAFHKALDRVHQPDVILAQQAFDHSADVVQELSQNYDLTYISNRDMDTYEPTKVWLENQGFPQGRLLCVQGDKLRHTWDCLYLIDDRPKTLVQFVYRWGPQKERKAFGLLYEYNRALTDVPGIFLAPTWAGIRYYFEKEKVL